MSLYRWGYFGDVFVLLGVFCIVGGVFGDRSLGGILEGILSSEGSSEEEGNYKPKR